jgi:VIT1/CCC1 family predicted Fe2+/Mn2+ transporter
MAVSEVAPGRLLTVVLGEILAGGISMTLGGYLSARTARQILDHRIATERYEVEHEPQEERAELRAIYRSKGFTGPLLRRIVDYLTSDPDRWHQAMVRDELGVVEDTQIHPVQQGVQVGISFVIGGLIPSIPLFLSLPFAQWWAYGLTALTALLLGALKAHYTGQRLVRAGLEFLGIVTLGTLAGVGAGLLLHGG